MLPPPKPQFARNLPKAGSHVARVIGIIYLGTIKGDYKGQPTQSFKLRMTWELPKTLTVFKEGEAPKPYSVSKEMTYSMGKKSTLRPIVEGIMGISLNDEEASGFSVENTLGKECIVSIAIEEGKSGTYVAIKNASTLLDGMECPPQINPTKVLSFEKWDENYFQSLPDFIKEKIVSSPEYTAMQKKNNVISPEEIPF